MRGGEIRNNSGSGVTGGESTTFTIEGGKISANNNGGVRSSGTFVMKDGEISGNTTSGDGGGVWASDFTMEGGRISGNSCNYNDGGGVYITWGSFTMKTGIIENNFAGAGCGVYGFNSLFTMEDGYIRNNMSPEEGIGNFGGGGVSVYQGNGSASFVMKGGEISGNSTSGMGGGVYAEAFDFTNLTFVLEDGIISGNSADNGPGGVALRYGTAIMKGGQITGNTGYSGGVELYNCRLTMEGGTISGNTGTTGLHGLVVEGTVYTTFTIKGSARVDRILLTRTSVANSFRFIAIAGPFSGTDLVGTSDIFTRMGYNTDIPDGWVGKPILTLDAAYSSGSLAALKSRFALGNWIQATSYVTTPITGYSIANDGTLTAP
jgi:hypothetical protein